MKFVIVLLLLTFAVPCWAKTMLQFTCSFPFFSDENKAKQTQKNEYTSVYIMTLEESGEWSALLNGSYGAAPLSVLAGNNIFNLFEVTSANVVNITTLQPNFELGRAKVVHSRHAVIPDSDIWYPTQFYGECTIK
jgi:hypothetical protein